ncbi:MAG: TRAM domain-containing protein, partial [Candidatus Pacebacteria bacterium]|nr:TRAM domain-containing protein [Candidatus Paceibacterota bacterium]
NQTRPDIVHIFKFSKRKNTPDYALNDWPDRSKKQRSRELTRLFQKMNEERNIKMKGKTFKVLVIEKRGLGRTNSGRAVVLNKGKTGFSVKAKIIGAKWNYLLGKVV